jgi:hypothetical protein
MCNYYFLPLAVIPRTKFEEKLEILNDGSINLHKTRGGPSDGLNAAECSACGFERGVDDLVGVCDRHKTRFVS